MKVAFIALLLVASVCSSLTVFRAHYLVRVPENGYPDVRPATEGLFQNASVVIDKEPMMGPFIYNLNTTSYHGFLNISVNSTSPIDSKVLTDHPERLVGDNTTTYLHVWVPAEQDHDVEEMMPLTTVWNFRVNYISTSDLVNETCNSTVIAEFEALLFNRSENVNVSSTQCLGQEKIGDWGYDWTAVFSTRITENVFPWHETPLTDGLRQTVEFNKTLLSSTFIKSISSMWLDGKLEVRNRTGYNSTILRVRLTYTSTNSTSRVSNQLFLDRFQLLVPDVRLSLLENTDNMTMYLPYEDNSTFVSVSFRFRVDGPNSPVQYALGSLNYGAMSQVPSPQLPPYDVLFFWNDENVEPSSVSNQTWNIRFDFPNMSMANASDAVAEYVYRFASAAKLEQDRVRVVYSYINPVSTGLEAVSTVTIEVDALNYTSISGVKEMQRLIVSNNWDSYNMNNVSSATMWKDRTNEPLTQRVLMTHFWSTNQTTNTYYIVSAFNEYSNNTRATSMWFALTEPAQYWSSDVAEFIGNITISSPFPSRVEAAARDLLNVSDKRLNSTWMSLNVVHMWSKGEAEPVENYTTTKQSWSVMFSWNATSATNGTEYDEQLFIAAFQYAAGNHVQLVSVDYFSEFIFNNTVGQTNMTILAEGQVAPWADYVNISMNRLAQNFTTMDWKNISYIVNVPEIHPVAIRKIEYVDNKNKLWVHLTYVSGNYTNNPAEFLVVFQRLVPNVTLEYDTTSALAMFEPNNGNKVLRNVRMRFHIAGESTAVADAIRDLKEAAQLQIDGDKDLFNDNHNLTQFSVLHFWEAGEMEPSVDRNEMWSIRLKFNSTANSSNGREIEVREYVNIFQEQSGVKISNVTFGNAIVKSTNATVGNATLFNVEMVIDLTLVVDGSNFDSTNSVDELERLVNSNMWGPITYGRNLPTVDTVHMWRTHQLEPEIQQTVHVHFYYHGNATIPDKDYPQYFKFHNPAIDVTDLSLFNIVAEQFSENEDLIWNVRATIASAGATPDQTSAAVAALLQMSDETLTCSQCTNNDSAIVIRLLHVWAMDASEPLERMIPFNEVWNIDFMWEMTWNNATVNKTAADFLPAFQAASGNGSTLQFVKETPVTTFAQNSTKFFRSVLTFNATGFKTEYHLNFVNNSMRGLSQAVAGIPQTWQYFTNLTGLPYIFPTRMWLEINIMPTANTLRAKLAFVAPSIYNSTDFRNFSKIFERVSGFDVNHTLYINIDSVNVSVSKYVVPNNNTFSYLHILDLIMTPHHYEPEILDAGINDLLIAADRARKGEKPFNGEWSQEYSLPHVEVAAIWLANMTMPELPAVVNGSQNWNIRFTYTDHINETGARHNTTVEDYFQIFQDAVGSNVTLRILTSNVTTRPDYEDYTSVVHENLVHFSVQGQVDNWWKLNYVMLAVERLEWSVQIEKEGVEVWDMYAASLNLESITVERLWNSTDVVSEVKEVIFIRFRRIVGDISGVANITNGTRPIESTASAYATLFGEIAGTSNIIYNAISDNVTSTTEEAVIAVNIHDTADRSAAEARHLLMVALGDQYEGVNSLFNETASSLQLTNLTVVHIWKNGTSEPPMSASTHCSFTGEVNKDQLTTIIAGVLDTKHVVVTDFTPASARKRAEGTATVVFTQGRTDPVTAQKNFASKTQGSQMADYATQHQLPVVTVKVLEDPVPTTGNPSTSSTVPSSTTSDTVPSSTTSDTVPSSTTSDTVPSSSTSDTVPSSSTSSTVPPSTTTTPSVPKEGLTGGQKAGIAFGVIGGVAIIGAAAVFFIRYKKKKSAEEYDRLMDNPYNKL